MDLLLECCGLCLNKRNNPKPRCTYCTLCKGWFTSFLLASCCNRKCIQNDLDARTLRWNRTFFLFLRRDTRPNHFICTSGRNATQAKRCEPALTITATISKMMSDVIEYYRVQVQGLYHPYNMCCTYNTLCSPTHARRRGEYAPGLYNNTSIGVV